MLNLNDLSTEISSAVITVTSHRTKAFAHLLQEGVQVPKRSLVGSVRENLVAFEVATVPLLTLRMSMKITHNYLHLLPLRHPNLCILELVVLLSNRSLLVVLTLLLARLPTNIGITPIIHVTIDTTLLTTSILLLFAGSSDSPTIPSFTCTLP